MRRFWKQISALFLALSMTLSPLPVTAFAADPDSGGWPADAADLTVASTSINRIVVGTVTMDDIGLEDVNVCLVQDDPQLSFVVNGPTGTTDAAGAYELDVSSLAAGRYRVRVSVEYYGAAVSEAFEITEDDLTNPDKEYTRDVTLSTIDFDNIDFMYDMTEGNCPQLDFADASTRPSVDWSGEAMTLNFPDTSYTDNLVRLADTKIRNGVIEFDAHREGTYPNAGGFGLALRWTDWDHWIYVGLKDTDSAWYHACWNGAFGYDNGWSNAAQGPSFGAGDTRHFKVAIDKGKVSLTIDGVEVIQNATIGGISNTDYLPMNAADVGFICGISDSGVPSDITIDNLYIFCDEDVTSTVTMNPMSSGSGTLSARIRANGTDVELGGTGKNQATEGDTVVITLTGAPAGKALGTVTVKKTGDSAAEPEPVTARADGSFTFIMPAYGVTVTGELKNTFHAALPQTEDGNSTAPKVGEPYRVTLTAENESTDSVTAACQWYRVDGAARIEVGTGSTYIPVPEDAGKPLNVVVTGTGEYTGIKTLTTPVVLSAGVKVEQVSLARSAIEMWMNDKEEANTGASVGRSTVMTATVSPADATNPNIEWTSSNPAVATIEKDSDALEANQAILTAQQNGTTTITVTVTSFDGSKQTDTCTVTVKTAAKGISVKNGETEVEENGFVTVYANEEDANHSITLTGEITPADATNRNLIWTCPNGTAGLIRLDRANASEDDEADEGTATGQSVRITAVGGTTNVGTVVVCAAAQDNSAVYTNFTVKVVRKLDHDVSIRIQSVNDSSLAPQFGQILEADVSQLEMTSESEAALQYQWYRTASATSENQNPQPVEIAGETNKTYALTEEDIGCTISVKVTADESTYYEGSRTAARSQPVEKADNYERPELLGCPTTGAGKADGYIVIRNYDKNAAYEYCKLDDNETWEDTWTEAVVVEKELDGENEEKRTVNAIDHLTSGYYQVRIRENATCKAGAARSVRVDDGVEMLYPVIVGGCTNGSVTRDLAQAKKGSDVTITVTADQGYELLVDSLKAVYVDTDGETKEVTLTPVANKAGQYTFTMPDKAVTIIAAFVLTRVTIDHHLTNITCSLGGGDTHEVDYGTVSRITLTPAEGYTLPEQIAITDQTGTAITNYTYDSTTGLIVITGGVIQDLTITAAGVAKKHTVQWALRAGGLTGSGNYEVTHNEKFTGALTANTGYSLPEEIQVIMGGETLTNGYPYHKATGVIEIEHVTGNVVIVAVGVRNTIPVTAVTIAIEHNNSSVTSDIPHVGDILTANVTPADATVTYQWFRATAAGTLEEIVGATGHTYTLTAADWNHSITVEVTGAGDYSGTVTSAATENVEAQFVATTGITLNTYNQTISVGDELTLTATVLPVTATNKNVTWSIFAEHSDTIVNNVVSLTENEDGTITVNAIGPGTVRINARTAAGQTANCIVVVERANVHTLNYMIQGGTATVSIMADGDRVTNGGQVFAGMPVSVTVTPAVNAHKVTVTVAANGQAVAVTEGQNNTWTFTMPDSDVFVWIQVTEPVPITSVTIEGKAQVGETLTADVTPADATVTYQWFRTTAAGTSEEIVGATGHTYTLTDADLNYHITVRVTGTGDYSGTVASTATEKVEAQFIATTGITLNTYNQTISTGDEFTLTATVLPVTATNKDVTWSIFAENSDTAVTDVVSLHENSDGTVTVSAISPGTVRINARTAAGQTANCIVVVERTNVHTLNYMIQGGTATVSIAADGDSVTNGGQVFADMPVSVTVTPAVNAHKVTVTVAANGQAVAVTEGQNNTWTFTMPDSDVFVWIQVTEPVPITSVTIEGKAQVGETLTANVTPADATVTYQWFRTTAAGTSEEIVGATGHTYTLTDADLNYHITVRVTGTGDYSGTVASTATEKVEAQFIATTGITLNTYNQTISTGDEFTLTATVLPATATNKDVTWSIFAENSDTAVTGVVSLHENSDGTVTVSAISPGTVRINACTAAGQTANCIVVVERANIHTLSYIVQGGTATVSITADSDRVTNGGQVFAGTSVRMAVTPATSTHKVSITVATNGQPVAVTKGQGNTWTFTMPDSDVFILIQVTEPVPITGVTIEGKAQVGETLTANVTPADATVTYQWFRMTAAGTSEEVVGATDYTYTLTDADVNCYITVKVTGTGDYDGTVTSTATEKVEAQFIATTGITLNTYNQTMSVGDEFTLATAVLPTTATNKNVTWNIFAEHSDIIVNNVVSLTENGDGTVTVNAIAPGTVRINARTAAGQTANCIVVVERANMHTLSYMIQGGTATVSIMAGDDNVTNGGQVLGGTPVSVTVTPATSTHKVRITVAANGQPVAITEGQDNTWTFTMPDSDVFILIQVTEPVPVTGVTIEGKTQVGETLAANVMPADATVTYQWFRATAAGTSEKIVGATGRAYTLTDTDLNQYITVKVTGTGDYSGTVTSTTMDKVEVPFIATTGITLNTYNQTISVGDEFTLTAAVLPTTATNKDITWSIFAEDSDSVVNNVVSLVDNGDGTVTVNAIGPGTVRINARTAAGQTANCTVVVERTDTYALCFVSTGSDTTVSVMANGQEITSGDKVDANELVTITAIAANPNHVITVTVNGQPIETAQGQANTWTFSMPGRDAFVVISASAPTVSAVAISGAAQVGQTLTANVTPADATVTYQWFRGANAIRGATSKTYVLVEADLGANISVMVTGTEHYTGSTVTSAAVGPVVEAAVAPVLYTITVDSAIVNGTVTASAETATAGTEIILTITPASGYQLKVGSVKVNGSALGEANGVYKFNMPAADVTITAEFALVEVPHTVTVNLTNLTSDAPETVLEGETMEITLTAPTGYKLPETVTVTMGGETVIGAYDAATGKIIIAKVTGNVVITAEGVEDSKTPNVPVGPSMPSGPSTPSIPATSTETRQNPDGSVTTIVTDNKTGAVSETTVHKNGSKVEKVTDSDKNVTITVTGSKGEVLTKAEIPAVIPAPSTRFVDVPEGHWADKAIHEMAALGIVNGVGRDRFNMNTNMTRGMLVTVLFRLSNGAEGYGIRFTDVSSSKYYASAVAWADKTGVVQGVSDTLFAPNNNITREQLAAMLYRYAKLLGLDTTVNRSTLNRFHDKSGVHDWAAEGMAWCVDNGIINGTGNDNLSPNHLATRAQVAVMLWRFVNRMR